MTKARNWARLHPVHVLLLQLDGLALPFVSLMRIAAHHIDAGDVVELRRVRKAADLEPRFGDPAWGMVYGALIFEKTRPLAVRAQHVYPGILLGGTGWKVESTLADVAIGEGRLDYSIYPWFKRSIGFTMRGCRLKCRFCVVPRKEGAARANASIAEIYRGDPHPRELLLLDNDFFGHPDWRSVAAELVEGKFKVSFVQGINARFLNEETAHALGTLTVRDDMLIGEDEAETHADRDYRRAKLREFGCRPYPMPFRRTPELVAFQRWVIQRHDLHTTWEQFYGTAGGQPRKLGPRRVSLPLFPDDDN